MIRLEPRLYHLKYVNNIWQGYVYIWLRWHVTFKNGLSISRRGVGDKPMSCKPGVASSIPVFSIKPLSMAFGCFRNKTNTQILNQPGRNGYYPGKPQKRFIYHASCFSYFSGIYSTTKETHQSLLREIMENRMKK